MPSPHSKGLAPSRGATNGERSVPDEGPRRRWRVLVVDDHPVVREGLAARIDREADLGVCGTAADAHEAVERVEALSPDIVVTDLSLGGKPGIELIKDLRELRPALPVLVLSIHDEALWAERVLRAGASGYIMKSQATENVVEAIRTVVNGGVWVSERINAALLQRARRSAPSPAGSALERLTDRELEVFQLIGQGIGPREIAARLYLSVKTIEVHREHIKEKLELRSTAELIRYAVTHLLNES
jgi:DNA-binding NarL/FixJ family response regulator